MKSIPALVLPLILVASFFSSTAEAKNFHEVQTLSNGFAMYRTGKPDEAEFKELCAKGVTQMIVLSGNAAEAELLWQSACPTMKVIYDHKQNTRVAISADFLEFFDRTVAEAMASGIKIAFRCNCGCHRTGRLAAYFNMKYVGMDAKAAIKDMREKGKYMWTQMTRLKKQVYALEDFIQGKPCRYTDKNREWCVRATGDMPE